MIAPTGAVVGASSSRRSRRLTVSIFKRVGGDDSTRRAGARITKGEAERGRDVPSAEAHELGDPPEDPVGRDRQKARALHRGDASTEDRD
jgi:hypothetical protein